jgi:hypothetical protein
MPDAVLRGPIDDTHLADLRLRNAERAKKLIAELGDRYCCHPNYKPRPLRGDTTTTTRTQ